jgi:hypothetical protein
MVQHGTSALKTAVHNAAAGVQLYYRPAAEGRQLQMPPDLHGQT